MSGEGWGTAGHIGDAEAAAIIYAPGRDREMETRVWKHLAMCDECKSRLEDLRHADRSLGELLTSLDVPPRAVSPAAIIRAAKAPERGHFTQPHRRAAAGIIALILAASAAAAIPASPLHRLIVRAMGGAAPATQRPTPAEPQGPPTPSRGVSFVPSSSLDIVFQPRGNGGAGVIHVRMVGSDQVSLSSTDAEATYRVGSNRITVSQSAGNYQLDVPRSLPELRVLVGSTVAFDRRLGNPAAADTFTIRLSLQPANAPSP